jgi:hypothetical protein
MYNPEEECLAIKPDLVFLWDEAWFGFARFSPFHRRRTAMHAAAELGERYSSEAYRREYETFRAATGELDPTDPKLLDMHLLPDPDQVRIRVYGTQSTHKSMSALRQGSMILVRDQDFPLVHGAFEEAYFTHTSIAQSVIIACWTWRAGRWSWRATGWWRAPPTWRCASAARSTATRRLRNIFAYSRPRRWSPQPTARRACATTVSRTATGNKWPAPGTPMK